MTPTTIVNDFEDDYKSDECDEHLATELFYNAFFGKESNNVSCEEFIKSKPTASNTTTKENVATADLTNISEEIQQVVLAANLAACSGKLVCSEGPEQVPVPTIPEIVLIESVESRVENKVAIVHDSDDGGIASKLNFEAVKTGKTNKAKRKSTANSSKETPKSKRNESDDDSDDINAHIKPKRRKAKPSADLVIPAKRSKKSKQTVESKTTNQPTVERVVVEESEESDSTVFPKLLPDVSSDDEISLSDAEGIELNVISYARGIPDKVSLTPGLTPAEHKRLWHVDIDDKFRHLRRNRYHTSKECRNCRRNGHLIHECPEPERIVCILCGERNHIAARCPEKQCSTCKHEGHISLRCYRMQHLLEIKCRICNIYGHTADICPDSWRRYHCTTVEGPPIAPEQDEQIPFKRKFCSWCGLQGHFAFECRKAKNAGITSRFVHSYDETETSRSKPLGDKPTRKQKKQKEMETRKKTSQAEQGRAAVFGRDFIPIQGIASRKRYREAMVAESSDWNFRKDKRKFLKFAPEIDLQYRSKKKHRLEPGYGGIEGLPSVQKRKKKNAESAGDNKPQNRRRERRKLKRMQLRNDRDKVKKKNLRQKGKV